MTTTADHYTGSLILTIRDSRYYYNIFVSSACTPNLSMAEAKNQMENSFSLRERIIHLTHTANGTVNSLGLACMCMNINLWPNKSCRDSVLHAVIASDAVVGWYRAHDLMTNYSYFVRIKNDNNNMLKCVHGFANVYDDSVSPRFHVSAKSTIQLSFTYVVESSRRFQKKKTPYYQPNLIFSFICLTLKNCDVSRLIDCFFVAYQWVVASLNLHVNDNWYLVDATVLGSIVSLCVFVVD